jgi:hypothetical protein
VEFEIRPALEICNPIVDWEAGELQFAVANNTGEDLQSRVTVTCGSATKQVQLRAASQSQSAVLRLPATGLVPGTNPVVVDLRKGQTVRGAVVDWRKPDQSQKLVFECVDLGGVFNDRVTQVFKNEYRSPRSPYCSLQIPLHGFGDWCYGGRREEPKIDDSALRGGAGTEGRLVSPQGIPLATPGPGEQPNIVFTSQWDNFPDTVVIPLEGRARHIYFLVAGTTHPMHSQFDNGEILVTYADGRQGRHPNTSYRSDVKTRSRWSLESAQKHKLLTVSSTKHTQ